MDSSFVNPYYPVPDMAPYDFHGLGDAVKTLVDTAASQRPHNVTVRRLPVQDAAALVELVNLHEREAKRKRAKASRVSNQDAVSHLVSAVGLASLLDGALLPALLKSPCAQALVDCGIALRKEAAGVGGSFGTEAGLVCDAIDGYFDLTPRQKPPELMKQVVEKIVPMVLKSTCTFA